MRNPFRTLGKRFVNHALAGAAFLRSNLLPHLQRFEQRKRPPLPSNQQFTHPARPHNHAACVNKQTNFAQPAKAAPPLAAFAYLLSSNAPTSLCVLPSLTKSRQILEWNVCFKGLFHSEKSTLTKCRFEEINYKIEDKRRLL